MTSFKYNYMLLSPHLNQCLQSPPYLNQCLYTNTNYILLLWLYVSMFLGLQKDQQIADATPYSDTN